ncbi:hypothetical protein LTR86_010334 [Recurvomyces mirabilis]|nr:hypothetical protein LTR86_010334 [Recurvomyces mirabilis]
MPPGGMMPNMNTMQRAQPTNEHQQVYAVIAKQLTEGKAALGQGWQSTFDMGQRAGMTMQVVSALRLLGNGWKQCLEVALLFESRTIQQTQSKEEYFQHMQGKLRDIQQKRQEGIQNGQLSLQMPNGNGMNSMPNNPMAGMNLPNNGMGMANGQVSMNGNPQNPAMLAHLQRQMQPASLQQPQQGNIDPAALQNSGMPTQMPNMNASNMQQMNGNPDSRMQLQQVDPQELSKVAQQLKNNMPEDQQNSIRQSLLARMSEPERQNFAARGQDPLTRLLLSRAREIITRRRQGQQQQVGGLQANGGTSQLSGAQAGGANIDFSSILGQQANALKLQESGEQVVPASNNNNFSMGGLPQNVNPQMLGNQSNNAQQDQMQRMLLQQQQQQRMQQQNLLAQRQALQQQQQLRGQPGGLNAPNVLNGGPAGQLNSPAMSMLNRPMVPPGQNGPGTPQQNRVQQTPQTPANSATQLMQHHQQMMNQNSAGVQQPNQGPQVMNQQRLDSIKQFVARPEVNTRMRTMSEAQRAEFMRALTSGQAPKQAFEAVARLGQQSGLPPNMNLSAVAPNQLSGLNGVPPAMTSAVPQFNSQPPPNQQPAQFDPVQMQRLQKNQEFRLQAMSLRPYPPQILPQLGIKDIVPDNLKTWGSLKHHLGLNRNSLPPGTLEKVQHLQDQWFQAHPEELNEGGKQLRANMARLQAQQAQQGNRQQSGATINGLPNMQMPNGQAPQAQMVPPTATMQSVEQSNANTGQMQLNQAQMNRAAPNVPMPSAADLAEIRQRNPSTANMSDEQIRGALIQKRREAHARMLTQQQQQQQQEAIRNAQLQRAQQQNQNGANQQGPRGQQQPPRPQQPTQATPMPGRKRPQQQGSDSDDIMEIPNPNAPANKQAQMPQAATAKVNQAQQKKPQAQTAGMSQMQIEQYNNMSPEQQRNVMQEIKNRQQAEALKRAQMGLSTPQQSSSAGTGPQQHPGPQTSAAASNNMSMLQQKLKNMMTEVARTNPKGPPIQVDAQTLEQAQEVLRRLWMPVAKMETTYVVAAQLPGFEKKLMGVMRARLLVNQNAKDASGAIRDYLSLSLHDLKQLELMLQVYFRELKATKDRMDEQKAQAEARQVQAQQSQPGLQRQPSFTGKQQQQQATAMGQSASQQGHIRKASSNSKAPPAPIENKSFDWPGSDPSPHGVPKYDGRSELTPDKLKFPPSKKRRTGQPDSQESTPAGQAGTPAGMMASPSNGGKTSQTPEQMRKAQPVPVKTEQESESRAKGWRCKDVLCEANAKGFETEELLRKHDEDEHSPVKDPLAFMLENAASALGVDQEGVPLAVRPKPETKVATKPLAGASVKRDVSNTPMIKQEIGTPQAGGSSVKTQGKAPEVAAPLKEKTLREVIEAKMGFEPPPQQVSETLSDANPTTEDDDDFLSQLLPSAFNSDQTSGIESWTDLTLTDFDPVDLDNIDWGLRRTLSSQSSSPELTPPSSELSSKESELSPLERLRINFEYDYWGTGVQGHVPEGLARMAEGLGIGEDGDREMGEAEHGVEDGDGGGVGGEKKVGGLGDEFDWSGDLEDESTDWEVLFGSQ